MWSILVALAQLKLVDFPEWNMFLFRRIQQMCPCVFSVSGDSVELWNNPLLGEVGTEDNQCPHRAKPPSFCTSLIQDRMGLLFIIL
jgi:hypothetical protein